MVSQRKCQIDAGSLEELIDALKVKLELPHNLVVVIWDEDFEEHRQITELEDIESDKAKIRVQEA